MSNVVHDDETRNLAAAHSNSADHRTEPERGPFGPRAPWRKVWAHPQRTELIGVAARIASASERLGDEDVASTLVAVLDDDECFDALALWNDSTSEALRRFAPDADGKQRMHDAVWLELSKVIIPDELTQLVDATANLVSLRFDFSTFERVTSQPQVLRGRTWSELVWLLTLVPRAVDVPTDATDAEVRDIKARECCAISPAAFDGRGSTSSNVTAISCFVADIDGITAEQVNALSQLIFVRKWAAVVSESFSSRLQGRLWKVRVWVPYSRPITRAEHPVVWRRMIDLVNEIVPCDTTCRDPRRLYFAGEAPSETVLSRKAWLFPGNAVDVDQILSTASEQTPPPRAPAPSKPEVTPRTASRPSRPSPGGVSFRGVRPHRGIDDIIAQLARAADGRENMVTREIGPAIGKSIACGNLTMAEARDRWIPKVRAALEKSDALSSLTGTVDEYMAKLDDKIEFGFSTTTAEREAEVSARAQAAGRSLVPFLLTDCRIGYRKLRDAKSIEGQENLEIFKSLADGDLPRFTLARAVKAIYSVLPDRDPATVARVLNAYIKAWPESDLLCAALRALEDSLRETQAEIVDGDDDDSADDDERVIIEITADTHALVNETMVALAEHPDVYSRAGKLVMVAGTEAHEITPAAMRDVATARARYVKITAKGERQAKALDLADAQTIVSRREHGAVRKLDGITTTPPLLPDGRLVATAGYDADSRLLYKPDRAWPELPAVASHADAVATYGRLASLFDEFDFVDRERCAATCVAGMLTLVGRYLFEGPAPMFLVTAPIEGAGKGLAAGTIIRIGLGRDIASSQYVGATELAKRLTSYMIAGRSTILFDNIGKGQELGGAPLCSALTEPVLDGRVLGKSEAPAFPNRFTFLGTGINPRRSQEMSRRVLEIRVEPMSDRPNARAFKRNLRQHVLDEQVELTMGAIAILRAFLAERPSVELRPFGSYDAWSGIVRAAVKWVSGVDVAPEATAESVSDEGAAISELAQAWLAAFKDPKDNWKSSADVSANMDANRRMGRAGRLESAFRALDDSLSKAAVDVVAIGRELGHLTGRVIALGDTAQVRFEVTRSNGMRRWRLAAI